MSNLTSLLVHDQVVPIKKIEEALQRQVVSGGDITTVLLEGDALGENVLASYCAAIFGAEAVSRKEILHVTRDVLRLVPAEIAERYRCVPLVLTGDTLVLAVAEPFETHEQEAVAALLGRKVQIRIACDVRVRGALQQYYNVAVSPRQRRLLEKLAHRDEGQIVALEHAAEPAKRLTISPPGSTPPQPAAPGNAPSEPPPPLKLSRRRTLIEEPEAISRPPTQDAWSSEQPLTNRVQLGDLDGIPTGPMLAPRETRAGAAIRKLRGPFPRETAEEMLATVRERDEIVEIFFAFAKQFFDYAALFVVHEDVADGRDAFGPGATAEEVQRIAVPLDIPGSFSQARESGTPWIGRIQQSELDQIVIEDLGRTGRDPAIVLPLTIRTRTVLLLYGDRSGEEFSQVTLAPLLAFVPRVVETFEQMIVRRKRTLGFGAMSTPPIRPPTPIPPHARRSDATLSGVAPPPLPRAGADKFAPTPSRPPTATNRTLAFEPAHRPSEAQEGELEHAMLEASRGAENRGAPSMPLPSLPTDASVRNTATSDRPRVPTLQHALGIGPSAPPPPRSRVSSPGILIADPPASDEIATTPKANVYDRATTPPPVNYKGVSEDETTAPRIDAWQNPQLVEKPVEAEKIRDWAPSEEVTLDTHTPIEALALAEAREGKSLPPRHSANPQKTNSVYVMKSDAVDDLGAPERNSRKPNPRPVHSTAPSAPSTAPSPSATPTRDAKARKQDPRRDGRGSLPPEVVRGSDAILPPIYQSEIPEPRGDTPTGNVIVDMGDAVTQLAKELMRQGPEDEAAILQALLRHGEAPLPVLAQAFPGPLWFSRHGVYRKLPRGRDVSAVARALYAYRERAVPYVASLLESNIPDRRFYAAMLAGDLHHQGLVTALMVRVFDDDDGVRALALELLPRFRTYSEVFSEGLALIRRALRVRSKDPFRRLLAVYACGVLRDVESIPDLIEALNEARELKDNDFLRTVQRALVEVTAEDFGQHPKKWSDWWERNRTRDRIEWLIDGLAHNEEWLRGLAFEELKQTTQQYFGYQPNAPRKERDVAAQKYRKWFDERQQSRNSVP